MSVALAVLKLCEYEAGHWQNSSQALGPKIQDFIDFIDLVMLVVFCA